MLAIIRNLRLIAEHCREGRQLPAEQARWLAHALNGFLGHSFSSVDDALGLRFPKGGVPWWREEGMRIRDVALRKLAVRFASHKSASAQANFIRSIAWRYESCNWPYDSRQHEMPPYYLGTPKQFLWTAFKSGAPMPLGERRLRSILAGCGERRRGDQGPSRSRIQRADNVFGQSARARVESTRTTKAACDFG